MSGPRRGKVDVKLTLAYGRAVAALQMLADEHEEQARVWLEEGEDIENSQYHARLAKIARGGLPKAALPAAGEKGE